MSRYSPELMKEALTFARNNPRRFLELAAWKSTLSEDEAERSLKAWNIQVPVGDEKNTNNRPARRRENYRNNVVPVQSQNTGPNPH